MIGDLFVIIDVNRSTISDIKVSRNRSRPSSFYEVYVSVSRYICVSRKGIAATALKLD